MNLDRAARDAVERHDRLLCIKTVELALGKLVSMYGVEAVKDILRTYLTQLEEY